MKKTASLLLISIGAVASIICLFLFFDLSKYALRDIMAYLTIGVTIMLLGFHMKLNFLDKEYFFYYILPVYLFLIGVIIHNYYTEETSFNAIMTGIIPNAFMIGGCIVGYLLNKFINKKKIPSESEK